MSYGFIKMERDDSGTVIYGQIATLRHDVRFSFNPLPETKSEEERKGRGDFAIMGRTPAGTPCQIGRAWEQKGRTGDNKGKVNFRLWFDDESFGDGLGLSAFPTKGGQPGEFDLVKERKRQEAGQ